MHSPAIPSTQKVLFVNHRHAIDTALPERILPLRAPPLPSLQLGPLLALPPMKHLEPFDLLLQIIILFPHPLATPSTPEDKLGLFGDLPEPDGPVPRSGRDQRFRSEGGKRGGDVLMAEQGLEVRQGGERKDRDRSVE